MLYFWIGELKHSNVTSYINFENSTEICSKKSFGNVFIEVQNFYQEKFIFSQNAGFQKSLCIPDTTLDFGLVLSPLNFSIR